MEYVWAVSLFGEEKLGKPSKARKVKKEMKSMVIYNKTKLKTKEYRTHGVQPAF